MSHKLLSDSDVDNEKEIQDLKRILPTASEADLKRRLEKAKSELHPSGKKTEIFDKPRPKKRKSLGPLHPDARRLDNTHFINKLVKATHRLDKLKSFSHKRRQVDHKVYCICKTPAASYGGEPMIQCDECHMWYHCECIGEDIQVLKEYSRWACKECEIEKSKTSGISEFLNSSLIRQNNSTGSKLSQLLIKRRHGEDWVKKYRVPSSLDSRLARIEDIKDCEEMTEDEIIAEMCRTHELMVQNNNELRDHIIKSATERQREEMNKEYEIRKRQVINTHRLIIHEMEKKQRTIQTQLLTSKTRCEKLEKDCQKRIQRYQADQKQAEVTLKEAKKEWKKEKKRFARDKQMWEAKFKETAKKSQTQLELRQREKKRLKLELEQKTEEFSRLDAERCRLRKRCTEHEEDLTKKDEQLKVKSTELGKRLAKITELEKKLRLKSSKLDEAVRKNKIAEVSSIRKIEVKLKAVQKRYKDLLPFRKEVQVLKRQAERYLRERKRLKAKISQLEKREQMRKNDNSRLSLQIKELEFQIGRQVQQRQSLPLNCSTGRAVRNCPMSSKSLRDKIKVMKLSAKSLEKMAVTYFGRGKFAPGTFDQWLNTKSISSRFCVDEDTLEDFIYGVICEKAGYNKFHPSAIVELSAGASPVTKVEVLNKLNGSTAAAASPFSSDMTIVPPHSDIRTPRISAPEKSSAEMDCVSSLEVPIGLTLPYTKVGKPPPSPRETLSSKIQSEWGSKPTTVVASPSIEDGRPRTSSSETSILKVKPDPKPVVASCPTPVWTPRISTTESLPCKPRSLKKKSKPSPGEVTVVLLSKTPKATGVTFCLRDIIFRKHCLRPPVEASKNSRASDSEKLGLGIQLEVGKSDQTWIQPKTLPQKKNTNKRPLVDTAKLSQVSSSSKKRRVISSPSPTIPNNGRRQRKGQSNSSSNTPTHSSSNSSQNYGETSSKSSKIDENAFSESSNNDGETSSKYSKIDEKAFSKSSKNDGSSKSCKILEKISSRSFKNDGETSNSSKLHGKTYKSSKNNRKHLTFNKVTSSSNSHRMTWDKTGVCGLCHSKNIPKVIDPEGTMLVCGGDNCPRPWWHRACLRPIPSKRFLKLNKRWYCPHCRKDYQHVHMRKKSNPKERLAQNLEPLEKDVERWLEENPGYERDDRLR